MYMYVYMYVYIYMHNMARTALIYLTMSRGNIFAPTGWADPGELVKRKSPGALELEFIYGYRGHDCRGNLRFNLAGELIYFISKCEVLILFVPGLKNSLCMSQSTQKL